MCLALLLGSKRACNQKQTTQSHFLELILHNCDWLHLKNYIAVIGFIAGKHASKQARKQARKQAPKQAPKQASRQASKHASTNASEQASKHASKQGNHVLLDFFLHNCDCLNLLKATRASKQASMQASKHQQQASKQSSTQASKATIFSQRFST